MAKLDPKSRAALPDSDFAVPAKRVMPIHDVDHVRMARNVVDQAPSLTTPEREQARMAIAARAEVLGMDDVQLPVLTLDGGVLTLAAADDAHPNKHPFAGILTRLDEPSDNPPAGSGGKRVILPTDVAAAALDTLVGMAVDFTPDFDGHDPQRKIGLIERAWIEDGALRIEGFFYAADFPEEVARIQAEQASMGFSYEVQARIQSPNADPLVISGCTFTGAAVLYKDKAAYTTTSLAAQADTEFDMTPEELQAAIAAAVEGALAPISERLGKIEASTDKALAAAAIIENVKTHAGTLKATADAMEADGIGLDPEYGHVVSLRKLASNMEASAAKGEVPYSIEGYVYSAAAAPTVAAPAAAPVESADVTALKAQLEGLQTELADVKAASFQAAAEPERKTLPPTILALLAKAEITVPEGSGKLDAATVDAALDKVPGMTRQQRMTAKLGLMQTGAL
ncbi:MAG: hypothetical protein ACXU85_01775 [Xanthobacteraceae bacterium]